jgi:dCMP deaminase
MTGWNGVPAGFNHCSDFFDKCEVDVTTPEGRDLHRQFSERFELHGEMNVLAHCAKLGIATAGADLVQQVSPCLSCAKLIIASGIRAVYFRQFYDRNDDTGLSLLMLAGVRVFKLHENQQYFNSLDIEELTLEDSYTPLEINGVEYFPTTRIYPGMTR